MSKDHSFATSYTWAVTGSGIHYKGQKTEHYFWVTTSLGEFRVVVPEWDYARIRDELAHGRYEWQWECLPSWASAKAGDASWCERDGTAHVVVYFHRNNLDGECHVVACDMAGVMPATPGPDVPKCPACLHLLDRQRIPLGCVLDNS